MHGGVGQVEEKVFVRLGAGLDEFHSLLGILPGDASLAFILQQLGHLVIAQQRMHALARGGGSAAHVVGVRDAEVAVEPMPRGQELGLIAQMPFAYAHGGIAQLAEILGDGVFLRVEPVSASGEKHAWHANAGRVATGQQLRSRCGANRRGIKARELTPFFRHAIQMRRAVELGAERANIAVAHVVDENQNQIRTSRHRFGKRHPNQQKEKQLFHAKPEASAM